MAAPNKWIAAQDPKQREEKASKEAKVMNSFFGVVATGGEIAATHSGSRQKVKGRGDKRPIKEKKCSHFLTSRSGAGVLEGIC